MTTDTVCGEVLWSSVTVTCRNSISASTRAWRDPSRPSLFVPGPGAYTICLRPAISSVRSTLGDGSLEAIGSLGDLSRVTNARTEAANTTIKHIKRTGRGFRNHDNYRCRIMITAPPEARRDPTYRRAITRKVEEPLCCGLVFVAGPSRPGPPYVERSARGVGPG